MNLCWMNFLSKPDTILTRNVQNPYYFFKPLLGGNRHSNCDVTWYIIVFYGVKWYHERKPWFISQIHCQRVFFLQNHIMGIQYAFKSLKRVNGSKFLYFEFCKLIKQHTNKSFMHQNVLVYSKNQKKDEKKTDSNLLNI